MSSEDAQIVVACQRLQLLEIARLFDDLYMELDRELRDEKVICEELPAVRDKLASARDVARKKGLSLDEARGGGSALTPIESPGILLRCKRLEMTDYDDFEELVDASKGYLVNEGINLEADPILQVLSATEIDNAMAAYRRAYGDISWTPCDYLVVSAAGLIGTLIDILFVRSPETSTCLKRLQVEGSPATAWVKENTQHFYEDYLQEYEVSAKVPYDITGHPDVRGLMGRQHRQMSLEHNLVFGPILAIISCMTGKARFIDKFGDLITIDCSMAPMELHEAFIRVLLHFLTDIFTKAGLSPTFLTLLQLVDSTSPFSPTASDVKVSWTAVSRYMYRHGYDVRHFLVSGLVPGTIDAIIKGYWWLSYYDDEEAAELSKLKLSTMLLMGHTIATSGTLLKTGCLFGMDPLALNWAELIRMVPVSVSFIAEAIKRDARIKTGLEAEWQEIYRNAFVFQGTLSTLKDLQQ